MNGLSEKIAKLLRDDIVEPVEFTEKQVPVFAKREMPERIADKYDGEYTVDGEQKVNNRYVDYYTALLAYADKLYNRGETVSLYNTIKAIALSNLVSTKNNIILDVGCGVGRTIHDLCGVLENSDFVGLDYSYNMVNRAKEILIEAKELELDISAQGFGVVKFQPNEKQFKNVDLIQGDACNLPFKDNSFDYVANTFLIDRVLDPAKCIQESIRVLKPGGLFILTNPLDFEQSEIWKHLKTAKDVLSIIENNNINIIGWHEGLIVRNIRNIYRGIVQFETLIVHGEKG